MNSAETPVPQLKDSKQRWWLMILLVTAMLFCYAQRSSLSIAAPYMSDDLGYDLLKMSVLLSAFSWIYTFMQMPSGWIVDRFGVRRAYALGFAFWSAMCVLTGLTKNLFMLMFSRVMLGTGQAVAFPASARATAQWFQDQERGKVTALYLIGVRVGSAMILSFGAWFIPRYNWQIFFILIGAVSFVWLAPWLLFLRKWEDSPELKAQTKKESVSFLAGLMLLKNRSVLGIFIGFFAYDYVWFVYQFWLPTYLKTERKFTDNEMIVLTAMPYVAMSVIIFLAGVLSDWVVQRGFDEKLSRKIFCVIGLLICCLVVPAGMVEDKTTAIWLLTIALSGLGIASPNTWTLTQAVCSKKIVGTVSGIQNFGGNVGGIIAPVLTGAIAYKTGSFALALGLCGVLLVIGALAYWFLIDEFVDDPKNI
jgi:MFS transporter, ACS family, D-galactonate transporter